jgi:hypothetical protein
MNRSGGLAAMVRTLAWSQPGGDLGVVPTVILDLAAEVVVAPWTVAI